MKYLRNVYNFYCEKIRNNIYKSLVRRFLITTDPRFLAIFGKRAYGVDNETLRRAKVKQSILLRIDCDRYRKFFYAAVHYPDHDGKLSQRNEPIVLPLKSKCAMFFTRIYMFIFERKLYDSLKSFENWGKVIRKQNEIMDDYVKNTTPEQRLDRALEYHIIKSEHHKKLKTEHNYDYNNDNESNTLF